MTKEQEIAACYRERDRQQAPNRVRATLKAMRHPPRQHTVRQDTLNKLAQRPNGVPEAAPHQFAKQS